MRPPLKLGAIAPLEFTQAVCVAAGLNHAPVRSLRDADGDKARLAFGGGAQVRPHAPSLRSPFPNWTHGNAVGRGTLAQGVDEGQ